LFEVDYLLFWLLLYTYVLIVRALT